MISANQFARVIVRMYPFLSVHAGDDARTSAHHVFVYMCVTRVIRKSRNGKIKGTLDFPFQFGSLRACEHACAWGGGVMSSSKL